MADVFISYRIADSAAHAGRLADALKGHFGRGAVFLAADDIAQGAQWRDVLSRELKVSRAVLAVIGPVWSTVSDRDGIRRLMKDDDVVRFEIREALNLGRPVIPVLVGNARLPAPSELPADISPLLQRNRAELRDDHWPSDVADLAQGLRKVAPALRMRDVGRTLASRSRAFGVLVALVAAISAGHVLLIRFDVLDAYSLRVLPFVLILVMAGLLLAHAAAVRRTR
jgi:hypothetical protein